MVLLAVLVAGGCGGQPRLDASSAGELHAQVAAVRAAAQDGDRAGALEALDGLADQVRDLEAGGSLSAADAAALRRGIERARRRARAEIAEPTPTATPEPAATATATATAAPKPPKPPKPGKGKGHGKGKGKKH
jgi:cell division septation protein DedD